MAKIMAFTKTVLKNLVSKPVTTSYPFEPAVYPERSRGHVDIDIENCVFCGLCSKMCPSGAITVDRATTTWTINRFDCIQCGYCTEKCGKKCLHILPGYQEPMPEKAVAVYVKPAPEPAPEAAAPAAEAPKAAPVAPAAPAAEAPKAEAPAKEA